MAFTAGSGKSTVEAVEYLAFIEPMVPAWVRGSTNVPYPGMNVRPRRLVHTAEATVGDGRGAGRR